MHKDMISTSTKTNTHSHDAPLTGLVCPLRVQLREGGSETKLNTDRVPSSEALARRVLSSLANDIARTMRQVKIIIYCTVKI